MRTLIDIGSMHGEEIRWGVQNGYEVHAFEPNPHLKDYLFFEFADARNTFINYAAAWDEDGEVVLHLMFGEEPGEDGVSVIKEKSNVSESKLMVVPSVNTGLYLKKLDKDIDILKINAEGAEYIILQSILDNFDYKRIKHWLVEDHSSYFEQGEWHDMKAKTLARLYSLGIKLEDYIFIQTLNKAHEELLG